MLIIFIILGKEQKNKIRVVNLKIRKESVTDLTDPKQVAIKNLEKCW